MGKKIPIIDGRRLCPPCGQILDLSCFYVSVIKGVTYYTMCKDCAYLKATGKSPTNRKLKPRRIYNDNKVKCNKCEKWFHIEDVKQYKDSKGVLRFENCKECEKARARQYNSLHVKDRAYYNKIRKLNKQNIINSFKTDTCADCKLSYPPYVLDLDHIDGDKNGNVSAMVINTKARILEEISKCELVCCVCHRIRTAKRLSEQKPIIDRSKCYKCQPHRDPSANLILKSNGDPYACKNCKLAQRKMAAIDIVNKIKNNPCSDCGNKYPSCAMDMDHIRGVKIANISALAKGTRKLCFLLEELDKCELVCGNCHRVRTHERRLQTPHNTS